LDGSTVEVCVLVAVGSVVAVVAAVAVRRLPANWVAVWSIGAMAGMSLVAGDASEIVVGEAATTDATGDD
jgi:hypothetical protein